MLQKSDKIALFMEGYLSSEYGKMGFGVLRFSKNEIVAVIDSENQGKSLEEITGIQHKAPIVGSLDEGLTIGANVLVIGISPSGGRIPEDWIKFIEAAIQAGMSIVNGLHDLLEKRYKLNLKENQWIWDVRVPKTTPPVATAKAMQLKNERILFVGTDMAAGKMTAGLELYRWLNQQQKDVGFIATGQIGITITGKGIPLDAFKVDLACGAVEEAVMAQKDNAIILIEGQGSLLHPGSTATLPLMRGSCPTQLILCHRAEKTHLKYPEHIEIPSLKAFIELNEQLATVVGTYPKAKVIAIALNTSALSEADALTLIAKIEAETGVPTTDVIRFSISKIGNAVLSSIDGH
ncbi:MAG: DUF1611 domain-containing protein [Flavobacteriaceae bacterium]